jgi:hypothetical protein
LRKLRRASVRVAPVYIINGEVGGKKMKLVSEEKGGMDISAGIAGLLENKNKDQRTHKLCLLLGNLRSMYS